MKKQLKDLKRGETFRGAGIDWLVLGHDQSSQGSRTFIVSADVTEKRAFDEEDKCDFAASSLRAYLNDTFLRELEEAFGAESILEHTIDLTADDGLRRYGVISAKVGLLTISDYRAHRDLLTPIGKYWWLATPYSGLDRYDDYVGFVCADGTVCDDVAHDNWRGVRPALYLKSDTLVEDPYDGDRGEASRFDSPSIEELEQMMQGPEWDFKACQALCEAAGMAEEWELADGSSFESVLCAAAEKLGIRI